MMSYLPENLEDQGKAAMRGALRLSVRKGMARPEKQAEKLTVNRVCSSPSPTHCPVSTNVIQSTQSGVRLRTRKIGH